MARENIVYTGEWFSEAFGRFFRDVGRSIAFGVIMFFSFVFLLGAFLISGEGIVGVPDGLATFLLLFFLGLPLCVSCWWLALEVADDRHWEKEHPSIWDDQETRWIAHTVRIARSLEAQGKTSEAAILLSDDIYAEAHRLIDETDEVMVRVLLAAILANTPNRVVRTAGNREMPLLLSEKVDLEQQGEED